MSTKNDELVMQLFNKLQAKKKEIQSAEKPRWKTSCTIGYNPDVVTDRVNIMTVTDVDKLVRLYGFLDREEETFLQAAEKLKVKVVFKWMGFTKAEWQHDIATRINQLAIGVKRTDLATLEKKLDSLISFEQRREMELAEIAKELAKDES